MCNEQKDRLFGIPGFCGRLAGLQAAVFNIPRKGRQGTQRPGKLFC